MNKKELALKIVELLFEFEEEKEEQEHYSLGDFSAYLNNQITLDTAAMRTIDGEKEPWIQQQHATQNSDISILLVLMYRYAKGYIKKALKDSLIQTPDEFSFLITLMTFESLTKTELISKQVMEITSGTEVIKRLMKNGFITSFEDEKDKRSVRVAVTEAGKKEIARVLPDMGMVSQIVVGNLNATEIQNLEYVLKKLDHYHNNLYQTKKNADLVELRGG